MNYHLSTDYEAELVQLIKFWEGQEPSVYNDHANYNVGYPSIGVGYALINLSGIVDWRRDFTVAGIDYSGWGNDLDNLLEALLPKISAARQMLSRAGNSDEALAISETRDFIRIKNEYDTILDGFQYPGPSISRPNLTINQMDSLFMQTLGKTETEFKNFIINIISESEWLQMNDTKEKIALRSLYFNGTRLFGAEIREALSTGNRFRVWWEIKYDTNSSRNGTNSPGIQNRRNKEALMFGLYENVADSGPECVSEALFVIRSYIEMMTSERAQFERTVMLHNDGVGGVEDNVESLGADLRPAVNMILERYVTDKLSKIEDVNSINTFIGEFNRQFTNLIDADDPLNSPIKKLIIGKGIDLNLADVPNYLNSYYADIEDGNRANFNDNMEGRNASADELIIGGRGNDIIHGGDGNDIIYGNGFDFKYDNDVSNGINELHGEGGNDFIFGGFGKDTIYGDEGNDYIEGGDGDDIMYGGDDEDQIHGDNGTDELYGEDGDDYLYGEEGSDFIFGGEGEDHIYGGDDDDYLYANTDKVDYDKIRD